MNWDLWYDEQLWTVRNETEIDNDVLKYDINERKKYSYRNEINEISFVLMTESLFKKVYTSDLYVWET